MNKFRQLDAYLALSENETPILSNFLHAKPFSDYEKEMQKKWFLSGFLSYDLVHGENYTTFTIPAIREFTKEEKEFYILPDSAEDKYE